MKRLLPLDNTGPILPKIAAIGCGLVGMAALMKPTLTILDALLVVGALTGGYLGLRRGWS